VASSTWGVAHKRKGVGELTPKKTYRRKDVNGPAREKKSGGRGGEDMEGTSTQATRPREADELGGGKQKKGLLERRNFIQGPHRLLRPRKKRWRGKGQILKKGLVVQYSGGGTL